MPTSTKGAPRAPVDTRPAHDVPAYTGHRWNAARSSERHAFNLPKTYRVKLAGVVPKPIHVRTTLDAVAVLDAIEDAKTIAIDSEFDTLDNDKAYTVQLSDGKIRALIDIEAIKPFRKLLADKHIRKIFHSYAADEHVLSRAGIEINGFYADTWPIDFLVNENRRNHGLKECADDWLGIPMMSFKDTFSVIPVGKKMSFLPPLPTIIKTQWKRFLEYASLDPYATFWLYKHHRTILERLPISKTKTLWDYYCEHERDFTLTLSGIMKRGVAIDTKILKEIGRELSKTLARTRHVFVHYAPEIGVTRRRAGTEYTEVIAPHEINLNSPAQLKALFYDTLEWEGLPAHKGNSGGARQNHSSKSRSFDDEQETSTSTNAEQLEKWAGEGKVLASCLLDYRRAATMRGTFIGEKGGKGLLAHVVKEIGHHGPYELVRTDLNQIGAVTMRLASRDPNLQNIPQQKSKDPYRMRRAFVARKGCKLIVADYNQFELRIMAHYSQDKLFLKAFREGLDLHSITSKNVFHLKCPLEEVKTKFPDHRTKGKAINFGLQYGMRAGLLGKQIKEPKENAQRYIDAYFDLYTGVANWMLDIVEQARDTGFVQTVLGRYRRVQHLDVDPDENYGLLKHAENQAMNSPIQGSVADIIKMAMNKLENDPWMHEHEARILLQVHDELIIEAPEIDAWVVKDYVVKVMSSVFKLKNVDIVVNADVADNWNDAKG